MLLQEKMQSRRINGFHLRNVAIHSGSPPLLGPRRALLMFADRVPSLTYLRQIHGYYWNEVGRVPIFIHFADLCHFARRS